MPKMERGHRGRPQGHYINADGYSQFKFDAFANLFGNGHGGAVQPHAAGYIQPKSTCPSQKTLLGRCNPRRFPRIAADMDIFPNIRRKGYQIQAALFDLPDDL